MSVAENAARNDKKDRKPQWLYYVEIARVDHWFKNVFMLPGIALAIVLTGKFDWTVASHILLAVLSTCLIASANYTINEWLDAEFDQHHPVKKFRPSVNGHIQSQYVYIQYFALLTMGLSLAWWIAPMFLVFSLALLIMGLLYNVKPFRLKDRAYFDVLSESINSPLRFVLGWTAVTSAVLPPISVLMAYWMGGAYLMALKRLAEYRLIDDSKTAGLYRASFQYYNSNTLLISSFFYGISSAFFLGIFLIKYRIEFLVAIPFLSLLFAWYLAIALKAQSSVQTPEKLYKESRFLTYVVFVSLLIMALFFIDIPWLSELVDYHVLG